MPDNLKKLLPLEEKELLNKVESFYVAKKEEIKNFFISEELEGLIKSSVNSIEYFNEKKSLSSQDIKEKQGIQEKLMRILADNRQFLKDYYNYDLRPNSNLGEIAKEITQKKFAKVRELFIDSEVCSSSDELERYLRKRINWETSSTRPFPNNFALPIIEKEIKDKIVKAMQGIAHARNHLAKTRKLLEREEKQFNQMYPKNAFIKRWTDENARRDKENIASVRLDKTQAKKEVKKLENELKVIQNESKKTQAIIDDYRRHRSSTSLITETKFETLSLLNKYRESHAPASLPTTPSSLNTPVISPSSITVTFHRKPKKSSEDSVTSTEENKVPRFTVIEEKEPSVDEKSDSLNKGFIVTKPVSTPTSNPPPVLLHYVVKHKKT